MEKIWNFVKDEEGLESVEYALVGGLILVISIVAITLVGTEVSRIFNLIGTKLGLVGV